MSLRSPRSSTAIGRLPEPTGHATVRNMNTELEEGDALQLDFSKIAQVAESGEPVIPVVVQHADTGEVLIVAYANEEALNATLTEGIAVFWSTSRNELWRKGKTSGDTLVIVEVRVNCEQNSVLYRVRPHTGGCCHTHQVDGRPRPTCYYRTIGNDGRLRNLHP